MNILIKLMSIVSLVIAPTLADLHGTGNTAAAENKIQIKEIRNTATDASAADFNNDPLAAALEKDGLIKGDYTLEIKDGGMIINGTKVSDEVYTRYKHLVPRIDTK
jgi:K(+)-stimulated pyrophosphate-energized sodium pump